MTDLPTFQVRAFSAGDLRTRHEIPRVDHLSEGERAAIATGNLSALRSRRHLRWN